MRYVPIGRVAVVGSALLLLLSVCAVSFGAEEIVTARVVSLVGTATVTQADGTTATLSDTSKPIVLPATIEMTGPKGSFSISLKCSLPSGLTDRFNTISWTMRQGESLRVSPLSSNRGVKIEYLKGTRKFFVDVNNRENLLGVKSITGGTTVVILQNRVTVPEKAAVLLTCPMNSYASVGLAPAQVSEVEFSFSPDDEFIQVVNILCQGGTLQVSRAGVTTPVTEGTTVTQPAEVPIAERLSIPVPTPETVEESPSSPR